MNQLGNYSNYTLLIINLYRETLKTKISLVQNSNQYLKERIINFEKIQDNTSNLCIYNQENELHSNDESSENGFITNKW